MDRPRPSVMTALFWAYWDLCHVLQKAWRPALFAFLILSFGSLAALVAPRLLTYDPAGQAVMRLAILVGLCFLLTPFFLAVHRLLLLGEEATRYDFKPSSPRFQLFFGWLAVGVVLLSFPSTLAAFAEAKGPVYYFGQLPLDVDSTMVRVARIVTWVSRHAASRSFSSSGCRCTRGRLAKCVQRYTQSHLVCPRGNDPAVHSNRIARRRGRPPVPVLAGEPDRNGRRPGVVRRNAAYCIDTRSRDRITSLPGHRRSAEHALALSVRIARHGKFPGLDGDNACYAHDFRVRPSRK